MCGSCAMTVNGRRALDLPHARRARSRSGKRLQIAPLANLPVVRDLVVDMREFFDKWAKAGGQFVPTASRRDEFARVAPESPARREVDAAIECIGCGVCYASCDVVAWNPAYLGPAALNRAWTLQNDVRDGGRAARLAAVAGDAGCHACHTQAACTERCPKQLVADRVDRRAQAHDGARRAQGRAVSARGETRLWLAQRASAAVLALCVLVHLVTMIVAVNGGLTAADILGRTRGNPAWGAFYARVRRRGGDPRADRLAHDRVGVAALARTRCRRLLAGRRRRAVRHRHPRRRGRRAVRTAGWRNRDHPSYWAFLVHRVSGLSAGAVPAAAFLGAGHARSPATRRSTISCAGPSSRCSRPPRWRSSFCLPRIWPADLRLLLVEFVGWRRQAQRSWVAVAAGVALFCALAFALNLY